ncbi:MAG: molybdopterin dinucleotide binding domain-containing protein [Anaerolineae bacterium]|nr:molybdopterin dinucleotide binding domain-containing protein [Anaerolineae bacterium]MDX9831293.1 molybdopterin dinucleotide binding domain-containing protein [Anaerolineae bacterium]
MRGDFTLITGRTRAQGDGLHQGRDSAAYRAATSLVEMNDDDMAEFGLKEGDVVTVSTPAGQVAVPVRPGDLPRGMLFMPMGPPANLLVGGETESTGMPSYKGQRAEVETR